MAGVINLTDSRHPNFKSLKAAEAKAVADKVAAEKAVEAKAEKTKIPERKNQTETE